MAMTNKEYVDEQGQKCPSCRSERINSSYHSMGGAFLTNECYCRDCEASWFETYQLIEYENLQEVDNG